MCVKSIRVDRSLWSRLSNAVILHDADTEPRPEEAVNADGFTQTLTRALLNHDR
jgi:hypothetical protein